MYRVYLIRREQGRRYIGLSAVVETRLAQHNAGESKWTAKYGPWALAWTSRIMDLSDVRKLENLVKRQKGGAGLDTLLAEYRGS